MKYIDCFIIYAIVKYFKQILNKGLFRRSAKPFPAKQFSAFL